MSSQVPTRDRPGAGSPPGRGATASVDVIVNPRRSPRLRVRCAATVIAGGASWRATTEDVGARGCQLVSPVGLQVGAVIQLVFPSAPGVPGLSTPGRVAWAGADAPFRAGIAFADSHAGASARWFDALVHTHGSGGLHGAPPLLPASARLHLGPPPRHCADFTPLEAALLLEVGEGVPAGTLRERFRDAWGEARHALFSLLARRLLTTDGSEAVSPASWTAIRPTLAAITGERVDDTACPAPAAAARPTGAHALYQSALSQLEQDRVAAAIVTLRGALSLAPGDHEIAKALGEVAFRGARPVVGK